MTFSQNFSQSTVKSLTGQVVRIIIALVGIYDIEYTIDVITPESQNMAII